MDSNENHPEIPGNPPPGITKPKRTYRSKYPRPTTRGYAEKKDNIPTELSRDAKKVAMRLTAVAKDISSSINKKANGITERESVDHATREAQALLIKTMGEIGLDAESVAKMLKRAIDLSFETGRTAKSGDEIISIPDLNATKNLLFLWGCWMGAGRKSGANIGTANLNIFGGSGLDEAQRSRVTSIIDLLEAEVKRRGLPPVCEGSVEAKDPAPLPPMVGLGEDEDAPAD